MTSTDVDTTRQAVAKLYEEHPYPDHGVVSTVAARMARPLIDRARERRRGATVRVLDAGCGTGEQALGLARAFPDVEVVGADSMDRSLERARVYAARHRIDVRFEKLDLLEPAPRRLGRFDLIVTVGVVHHLPDPELGLRRLADLATSGSDLLGMVYGRIGRTEAFHFRDALQLLSGTADRDARLTMLDGLRLGRAERLVELAGELLRRRRFGPDIAAVEALRRVVAGHNRAYLADCFTHAHELTFTWAEVAALLDAGGWRWRGWAPRSGMPDHPEMLFRGEALVRSRELDLLDFAAVCERVLQPSKLYFVAQLP